MQYEGFSDDTVLGFDSSETRDLFFVESAPIAQEAYKAFEERLGLEQAKFNEPIAPYRTIDSAFTNDFRAVLDFVSGGAYGRLADTELGYLIEYLGDILADRDSIVSNIKAGRHQEGSRTPLYVPILGTNWQLDLSFNFEETNDKEKPVKLNMQIEESSRVDNIVPLNAEPYRQRLELLTQT